MSFGHVAIEMVSVSLPIALGWVVSRLGLMSEGFERELSRLVLDVALPALVVSSVFGATKLPGAGELLQVFFGMMAFFVLAFIVACVLCAVMRVPKTSLSSFRFIIMFGNCGFIGFPVITAILGKRALLYATIGLIPSNLFIFTLGIMMFRGIDGGWKAVCRGLLDCLKMPTLLASLIVIVCMATGFTDWGFVGDSVELIGQMTTPLRPAVDGGVCCSLSAAFHVDQLARLCCRSGKAGAGSACRHGDAS